MTLSRPLAATGAGEGERGWGWESVHQSFLSGCWASLGLMLTPKLVTVARGRPRVVCIPEPASGEENGLTTIHLDLSAPSSGDEDCINFLCVI